MALVTMEFDTSSLKEVTFSDIFDTSYKGASVSSVSGTAYKLGDSDLYFITMAITLSSITNGADIGKFKKFTIPRIVVPVIADSDGAPDGGFYGNSSDSYTSKLYGHTKTGVHYVYFTGRLI